MKYMFVIPSLSKGGAERVVCVLASGLAARGENVTVLRYFKTDGDYPIDERVNVITLSGGYESDYNKISTSQRLKFIKKTIKEVEPDQIIPFLKHVNIQTYLAAPAKYRKRVIFTVRYSPYLAKRGKNEIIHDFLINHFNKTIVQNQAQKDYFKRSAQKRIHIMANPVNESFLAEDRDMTSTDSYTVVAAGRLSDEKNFSMLIRAFDSFSKDKEDVCLNIYGEGKKKDQLQALIDSLQASDKVKLMGRTNDLIGAYKRASLFVLSSNHEGMPNALLEAMAIGLPCIATDCPTGPSEMIENGENGLLVPVDDAEKMREAIEYMYNNREKAEEMGKRAREFVSKNYRIEKIVDRFLEIVDQN